MDNKPMKTFKRRLFFLVALTLLQCKGESEPDLPGSCPINCSGAAVASPDMVLQSSIAPADITCFNADGVQDVRPAAQPVRFIFRSLGVRGSAPGGLQRDRRRDGEPGSIPIPKPGRPPIEDLPLAPIGGIAFFPEISGAYAPQKTNAENASIVEDPKGVFTVTPYQMAGLVTGKSQWCSDACGIMVVEVWPMCLPGAENPLSVQVRSGGIVSDVARAVVNYPEQN